jgi:hypothetical protein
MRDSSTRAKKLWLRRIIRGIRMREYEAQEEKAGEYRAILGERWEIHMFGHPTPTRILEWL